MKKIILLFVGILLSLLMCNVGFCKNGTEKIQYDDYRWGMEKSEVKKLIKEKGFEINDSKKEKYKNALYYDDIFFGKKGSITLSFTKNSNRLFDIKILFENQNLIEEIRPIFEEKYGNFEISVDYADKLIIYKVENNTNNTMGLFYHYKNNNTLIGYFSHKYYELYEREKQNIKQKDEDKF